MRTSLELEAHEAPPAKLHEWEGHFATVGAFREEARRWQLHRARSRVGRVTWGIACLKCAAICVFSAADARHEPGLQHRKEWAVLYASVGAAAAMACAAACGADWPQSWWLARGRTLLALQRVLLLALAPFQQAVALRFQPLGPVWSALVLCSPAIQACVLALLADVTDELRGVPPLAVDAAAVAATAALAAHPLAAPVAAAGAIGAAAVRAWLAPRSALPSAHAVASWQVAQQRSQTDFSDFLAARQEARLGQVRATMALAGALCGLVGARGALHGWHAVYNALAAACMLATAVLPSSALAVLFKAWPSVWTAVCVIMLPFHAATQQCAMGYDMSPAPACVRLKSGGLDGAHLLPFLVHCAVGPGLRLPGFSCYIFLCLPVFGFVIMELPSMTQLTMAERCELAMGFMVSALLAAHGVLSCDAAERDAHNQRERVRAEKAATKEFTRYILHEVRVPFNVVRLGVDAIEAWLHDAKVGAGLLEPAAVASCQDVVTAMATSADSMSRIINDVLDLAKIEEGKLQLRHDPFNGGAMLAELSRAWATPAADCGVTLTVALEPSAASLLSRRALLGDSLRLQQILNNLVSNSLKFTPRGGTVDVRARVRAHARSGPAVSVPHSDGSAPEERTWLILDVVDSGCGIAECDLPHLFRPYSQLLSGLRRAGGTGLGLNLSRTLSTRCGGSLSCVSAPGKGSTFTVRIPYALGAAPPEPLPRDDAPPLLAVLPPADGASEGSNEVGPLTPGSGAPARPAGGFTRGHSIAGAPVHRALVVDDSPMSRMVLVRLLGAMGVAADAADGGQAGVDAVLAAEAAGSPYTIVFMDREMPPGLDGEAATRALRSAGCEVPIVALTGNALQDDRDSFFAAGCTAFLTKPATRDHIAAVLRSVDGVPEERRGSRRLQPWLHYQQAEEEAPAPAETAPQDA